MSALGSLVVKLALEYAEYTKGLDKSSQDSLKFAQNAQRHFDTASASAKSFFADAAKGALAYLGVSSAVDTFNVSLEKLASLDDMAQKTGSSVESLSRLQKVAEMTGFEFGNVDSSIVKLARGIGGLDEDGSKAVAALSALNVEAKNADGSLRDSSDIVIDVAKNLQNYKDDAAKASVATDLFGKSGADLLPYLNDVAEKIDGVSGYSTEAAQKATELQDNFGALKVKTGELSTQLAVLAMPVVLEVFKTLAVLGAEVGYVFKAVGTEIGGIAAQVAALATGDWSGAQKIGEMMKVDAVAARAELDQWTAGIMKIGTETEKTSETVKESLSAAVAAIAAAKDAEKKVEDERKKRIAREERDNESRLKSQNNFISAIEKEAATWGMSAKQIKLYEAAQQGIKGKRLEHIESVLDETEAKKAAKKAEEDEIEVSRRHAEEQEQFNYTLDAGIDALKQQVSEQRNYNDRLGLSKDAIKDLNTAEIERQAIALNSRADLMDQIDFSGKLGDKYREEARLLRELNALKNAGVDKQTQLDQVNQSLREQADMWVSIDRTAHDTFVSVLDGGKDTATRLRDTLKNTLFDWLYQMTIKKWFINVSAGLTATASGSAMAANGDTSNPVSSANSLWDAFSSGFSGFGDKVANSVQMGLDKAGLSMSGGTPGAFAQGAGTVASYGAGIAVGVYGGRAISGGYSVGDHGNALINIGTAAGAIFGGPIGAAIGGAIAGGINRTFGMREKEMGGQTVTGALGTDNLMRNQSWTQDGGLFRSDRSGVWSYGLKDSVATTADGKSYVDSKNLDSDKALLKILNGGYDAVKSASTEFAKILGLNADQIATRNDALNLTLGKTQEENDKAIAAVFGGIADAIALDLIPNIAALKKEGESSAGTMARLAGGLLGVNNVISAMGFDKMSSDMGGAKSAQNLLDATGGMEKFSAGAAYFTENFLSEAEKMKPSIDAVASTLASLGMSNLKSVEDFKLAVVGGKDANGNLVKGLDLTTDAGAKTFASLMAISPQFKAVADYTDSLGGSLSVVESELKKTNEGWQQQIDALEKAKLSQEQLRESELTGVADSTKLLIERVHALQDEATESAKAKAAADKLAATNESLEARIDALVKASLTLDQQRQLELTGVADSTKLLIQRVHVLEDEATASAKAKAAADKLAATNESLEARIDALVKASLSLDEQRQAELTGVADSTKLLIQRVHALEDEATASEKAKAAIEKLKATNDSIQQQIDSMVRASLPLDEQRKLEVIGIDGTTLALKKQLWALEDSERALLDKAAKEKQLADDKIKAQQEAESSFNKWLGDVKSAFDSESGVFKSIIDKFTQIGDSITDYRHSLDVGSHALLTPEAQYQANKADWEKLAVAIDNKEEGALEKLQAVTDAFLESSKERNASSAEYFKDVDAAKRVAEKSADIAYTHVDVAKQQLNYLEQQVKGLFDINESVKTLASLMGGSGSTAQALNSSGMSARDLIGIESNVSQNLASFGGFDSLYNKTLAGDQDAMKTLQQQMVRWAGFDLKSEQYDRLVGKDSLAKMLDLFNLRIEDFKSSLLTTWNGKEQNLNFDRSGLFAGTTSYAKIADELKAMQAAYVPPAAYNRRADIIETRLPPQFAESTRVAAAPVAVGGDEESKKLLRRNNELMEKLINANITGSNGVVGSVKNLTQKFSGLDKSKMLEKAQGG